MNGLKDPDAPDVGGRALEDAACEVVDVHGSPFHRLTEAQTVDRVLAALGQGRGGWTLTANLDLLRMATRSAEFRALWRATDVVVADGMPVIWASRLQGTPLPERVTGSNLIFSLSAGAAREGRSIFLLGGAPGAAEGAARRLLERYPGLVVAGTYCPPFGFEKDPEGMREISQWLREARPDVVYVGVGSPKTERLIASMRQVLPGSWWIGVGISFSFVTGEVKRAPAWLQRCGLEWLARVAQEPRRLAGRYLLRGLPFAAELLATSAMKGLAARIRPGRKRSGADAGGGDDGR